MGYKPLVYKTTNENFIETMYQFTESWYEIKLSKDIEEYNFRVLFGIKISNTINKLLNFFMKLHYTVVYGKKKYMYNGLDYLFKPQFKTFNVLYDKKLNVLFLFQEGVQDFYFGIKNENFTEDNPMIYKILNTKKSAEYYKYYELKDFLVYHICTVASKIRIKSYKMFIEDNMENKLKSFKELFEYEKQFTNFTIYEKENVIASITKDEGIRPILTVNVWESNVEETINEITKIFNWNGWSDNNERYKL
jgi:hypothetical protein